MLKTMTNAVELLKETWPAIQPVVQTIAVPTAIGLLWARFFLRGNIRATEFEKLKEKKLSEVANQLLEDGHITYTEYHKWNNSSKIAQKADEIYRQKNADEIQEAQGVDRDKLDMDWLIRFLDNAGNISDEQIQDLWAKVLAGEIKSPGTFSLKFVDTLKNLSKEDGETIQTLASYAIKPSKNYYLCTEDILLDKYGYADKLLTMYDYDIIAENAADSYSFSAKKEGVFMSIGSLTCYSHNQTPESFRITMQRFTKTGSEFIRLVKPNEQYLTDFFSIINNKYPNLNLTLHRGWVINGRALSLAPDLLRQE